MNLEGKIDVIKTAKDNIKSAIIAKGVVPSGNISTYASAISEIDTTNNTNLTINPSTTVQTFTVSGQYTGYETVKVNAVTASIDSDIKASNIKSGVNILGVTGNVVELQGEVKTETLSSVNGNTYVPSSGANGITSIKVNPKNMGLTITPSTTEVIRTVPSGYSGHGNVKVEAVNASIDNNIKAGNIKQGVNILGVNGTMVGLEGQTKTVTPTTTTQTIVPDNGKNGLTTVTISGVDASIDSNIKASNIKSGVNILGVTGMVTALAGETRTVSITSTSGNTFTPSSGKNGITSIKCNPTNKALTITPSTTSQTFTVPSNYSGYGIITCNASSGGVTPTGTLTITENGSYDVTDYASADVNVSGGSFVGLNREVVNDKYQVPESPFTFRLPNGVTDLGSNVLRHAFYTCWGLTNVDLSNLIRITGQNAMLYAFEDCPFLTSVDLSSLTTVTGQNAMQNAFVNCSITSLDLSSLTTVSGDDALYNAFRNCTKITNMNFNNLTLLTGFGVFERAFNGCTKLTTLSFPSLTSNSFGSYTNQFNDMLLGVTGCTVHFPSNLQSVIGSWSDVTSGFGGTNTTVLFDLPATT